MKRAEGTAGVRQSQESVESVETSAIALSVHIHAPLTSLFLESHHRRLEDRKLLEAMTERGETHPGRHEPKRHYRRSWSR